MEEEKVVKIVEGSGNLFSFLKESVDFNFWLMVFGVIIFYFINMYFLKQQKKIAVPKISKLFQISFCATALLLGIGEGARANPEKSNKTVLWIYDNTMGVLGQAVFGYENIGTENLAKIFYQIFISFALVVFLIFSNKNAVKGIARFSVTELTDLAGLLSIIISIIYIQMTIFSSVLILTKYIPGDSFRRIIQALLIILTTIVVCFMHNSTSKNKSHGK